ncbi:hypothetical protein [uncultured Aliivibrio sp.]|uniref:hypothetical protein n=1 Tax=uncultured Aliivibrio sp. TaxID=873085 RepID=UPI002609387A|nr:hypothetical protein [uncultured Aliivibrio sp.]
MTKAIPRFIALYSATSASIETHQGDPFFSHQDGPAFSPTRDDFLNHLSDVKRAYPLGFYVAYLRWVDTEPCYFSALVRAVHQHMYVLLPFHQKNQHAVVLATLYFLLTDAVLNSEHNKAELSRAVSISEAIRCYGASYSCDVLEAALITSVTDEYAWLAQHYVAFEEALDSDMGDIIEGTKNA